MSAPDDKISRQLAAKEVLTWLDKFYKFGIFSLISIIVCLAGIYIHETLSLLGGIAGAVALGFFIIKVKEERIRLHTRYGGQQYGETPTGRNDIRRGVCAEFCQECKQPKRHAG